MQGEINENLIILLKFLCGLLRKILGVVLLKSNLHDLIIIINSLRLRLFRQTDSRSVNYNVHSI